MQKIKITKEEFNEMYEIEGITGDTEETPAPSTQSFKEPIPNKQDTTPEFLTEEEEAFDKELEEKLNWNEEDK